MDDILVQLYYERYGWSVEKIAKFISRPTSYIRQILEEGNFKLPVQDLLPAELDPTAEVSGKVQAIKDAEVVKQELLQPAYVHAEALLLAKVIEALNDPSLKDRIDAHDILRAHAATIQSLKQHAVVNKVIDEKNSNSGIQINVIGMIQ